MKVFTLIKLFAICMIISSLIGILIAQHKIIMRYQDTLQIIKSLDFVSDKEFVHYLVEDALNPKKAKGASE